MGRQFVSGKEAALLAAEGKPFRQTENGVILFPYREADAEHTEEPGQRLTKLPYLLPASPEEAYRMTEAAAAYAATYGVPVAVRLEPEVAGDFADIELHAGRRPGVTRRQTAAERQAAAGRQTGRGENTAPQPVPSRAFSDSRWNSVSGRGKKCILTGGICWSVTMDLLNGYGDVRVVKIGTPEPFPEEAAVCFLKGVTEVMTVEDAGGDLLLKLYALKGKYDLPFRVIPAEIHKNRSEEIWKALLSLTGREAADRIVRAEPVPERSLFAAPILPDRAVERRNGERRAAESDRGGAAFAGWRWQVS